MGCFGSKLRFEDDPSHWTYIVRHGATRATEVIPAADPLGAKYLEGDHDPAAPARDPIYVSDAARTFNVCYDYALCDRGSVWFRPRQLAEVLGPSDAAAHGVGWVDYRWQRMPPPPKMHKDAVIRRLSVDGANMLAIDDYHVAHYRKLFNEEWLPKDEWLKKVADAKGDDAPLALMRAALGAGTPVAINPITSDRIACDALPEMGLSARVMGVLKPKEKGDFRPLPLTLRDHAAAPGDAAATDAAANAKLVADVDVDDHVYYHATSINHDANAWEKEWFALPVLGKIVGVFTRDKELTALPDSRAVDISHRGQFVRYLNDGAGQQQPMGAGVTTAYILAENGREMRLMDPWAPKDTQIVLPCPERAGSVFIADGITSAASVVCLVGWEYDVPGAAGPTAPRVALYTRLADIDSEGTNPVLKYGFSAQPDRNIRVLPVDPSWERHPLIISEDDEDAGDVEITNDVSVVPYGQGNGNKELRVMCRVKGAFGFIRKPLVSAAPARCPADANKPSTTSPHWTFVALPDVAPPPDRMFKTIPTTTTCVDDFTGHVETFVSTKDVDTAALRDIELRNFGTRSLLSEIVFTKASPQPIAVHLLRRDTFLSFLGAKDDYRYDVVRAGVPQDVWGAIAADAGVDGFPVDVSVAGPRIRLRYADGPKRGEDFIVATERLPQ